LTTVPIKKGPHSLRVGDGACLPRVVRSS